MKRRESLLTCTLAYQLALNAMDEVKEDPSLYRLELKGHLNKAEKLMESILAQGFDDIYMEDEEIFSIFIERASNIMEWVATAPYDDVLTLGKALKEGHIKFKENE